MHPISGEIGYGARTLEQDSSKSSQIRHVLRHRQILPGYERFGSPLKVRETFKEEVGSFADPPPGRSTVMLVLSRKLNQEIHIGENIVVRVIAIKGNQVRLGIVAPAEVPVLREEILTKVPTSPRQPCSGMRELKCDRC